MSVCVPWLYIGCTSRSRDELEKQHGVRILKQECCFDTVYQAGATHVTMLREPRAHTLGQFVHCRYSDWAHRARSLPSHFSTRHVPFPHSKERGMYGNLETWLRFFMPCGPEPHIVHQSTHCHTAHFPSTSPLLSALG